MRRRMMMNVGKTLPYDAEIEYLENNALCYINTGVMFTANMEITCTFSNAALKNYAIYGSNNGASYNQGGIEFFYNKNFYEIVVPYSQTQSSVVSSPIYEERIVHHSRLNKGIIELDDWSRVINMPDYYCTRELFLFGTNRANPWLGGSQTRIYAFSILLNGYVILDLIPVRIGTTGYMYDKVSGQLFGNAGTGEFVLGADKIGGGYNCLIINMLPCAERRAA